MTVRWPLVINQIRGGSNNNTFGKVRTRGDGSLKPHQGWDLSAILGTPCYALDDGEVEFVGDNGDFGLIAVHSFQFNDTTYYAAYAHLQSAAVKQGDSIFYGQKIGYTGKSGNAFNLPPAEHHLHFETRTTPLPGLGLAGRVSPMNIYGVCPIKYAIISPINGAFNSLQQLSSAG